MDYDDETQNLHIHLKKGLQIIDGDKAEQLLRYRHSNPNENGSMTTYPSEYGHDDFGRMRTQREFLVATLQQTLQIKNITKIKKLSNTIVENLDTNIKLDNISPYVPSVSKLNISSIESLQLPGESRKYNNLWFFAHNELKTQEMVEELINELEGITIDVQEGNYINSSKK